MSTRLMSLVGVLALCAGCHRLPVWSGEVEVTPLERESIAKCGRGELTPAGKQRITRTPYIQSTTMTSTMVAWGSRDGLAEVVLSEPGGKKVASAPAAYVGDPARKRTRLAEQDGRQVEAEDLYLVRAEVKDLQPGHLYCYQIVADGKPLTELAPIATATPPGTDQPVRFVALGDSGNGSAAQRAIARRMTATPFDFLLFLGDIAYASGTPEQLDSRFFEAYEDILKFVPAYPSIGNHERRTSEGKPYFEAFVLPPPERYYSFDWGDIHFVAIDTTQRDSEQVEWLDRDLAANQRRWVIVYGHHPMYTNSLRGPQKGIREAFAKIVTKHKVDLVLAGHEHQYERFRIGGVNYVVSGGGGGRLTKFYGDSQALTQATVHHFLAFSVDANKLEMRAIDINGREIEKLELKKAGTGTKMEVDDKPTHEVNPVPPEVKTKPDEKLHDEPDDDTQRKKLPAEVPPPTKTAPARPR